MKSTKEILDFIEQNKSFLKSRFHIVKIGLFGSYVRQEQKEDSDLDLIIEFEENTPDLYELKHQIKDFFRHNLDVDVDICREKYLKPGIKESLLNEVVFID